MNAILSFTYQQVPEPVVRSLLRSWPSAPVRIAHSLIKKYGMPHEATPSLLIWNYNSPWKRTILHRQGVRHNLDHPHVDLLEQTVDTKVPEGMQNEIAKFDGSILIDRTRGEMTSFCENERANIIILNLAHDIALGRKTADEAIQILRTTLDPLHRQWPSPYRDALQFTSIILADDPDMVTAEPN